MDQPPSKHRHHHHDHGENHGDQNPLPDGFPLIPIHLQAPTGSCRTARSSADAFFGSMIFPPRPSADLIISEGGWQSGIRPIRQRQGDGEQDDHSQPDVEAEEPVLLRMIH
jgi:hypothetical protein